MSFLRGFPIGGGGVNGGIPGVTIPGTPGSIAFFGATGFITEDNANLFFDDTNNRVGIGTNAPSGKLHVLQSAEAGGTPILLNLVGGALTGQAASTEKRDVIINLARTVTFATGAITTQRAMTIAPPTYAFAGASVISNASTLEITGAPVAGTLATITRPIAVSIVGSTTDLGSLFVGDNSLSTYSTDPVAVEIALPANTTRRRGFQYSGGALTALAGGELSDISLTASNIEFGSGTTLALQRSMLITGPTLSATSAKTITEAATLAITAPTKGANVTYGTVGTNSTVYAIKTTGAGGIHCTISGVDGFTPGPAADFCFGTNAAINMTAGTEYIAVLVGAAPGVDQVSWNGAPAATQKWFFIDGPQLARSGGASTITTAASFAVDPPVAGTGITITNNYAMWCNGDLRVDGTISTGNGATTLAITNNAAGTVPLTIKNLSATGASSLDFQDQAGVFKGNIGYNNNTDTSEIALSGGTTSAFLIRKSITAADVMTVRNTSATGFSSITFEDETSNLAMSLGYDNTLNNSFIFVRSVGSVNGNFLTFTLGASSGTTATKILVSCGAHTTMTNVEQLEFQINPSQTKQFGQNTTLALQRTTIISSPTYSSSVATKTITEAVLFALGTPVAGTNVVITNAYSLTTTGSIRSDSSVTAFAAAKQTQQVSGANLTNNVASGGTDNTIANYTDLTTYATDAAAIRNNIYQLARKLKQVNDALRLYGFLT